MAEVAHVGEDHRDAVLIGGGNHLFVANRTTGLNDAAHANGSSGINTVAEREEGVGRHSRTFHFQTFITGFNPGDFGGVNAAHLACAYPDGHILFGVHNGVGFNEFRNDPAEQRIAQLLLGRLAFGNHAQFAFCDHTQIGPEPAGHH